MLLVFGFVVWEVVRVCVPFMLTQALKELNLHSYCSICNWMAYERLISVYLSPAHWGLLPPNISVRLFFLACYWQGLWHHMLN